MSEKLEFQKPKNVPQTKAHWRTFTNKEYLIGEMLPSDGVTMTLIDIKKEEIQSPKEKAEKAVLYFKETKLKIIANKTNLEKIAEVLDSLYPVDWIGKKITFVPERHTYFGKSQLVIRVKG